MNIMADKIGQYLRNKWNFGNRRALFPRDQYYMWAPGTEPQIAKSVIVVNSDKQPVGLPGDRVNVSGFTRTTPVVTTKSVKPSNTELKVPQIDTNEYAITTLPKDIATAAEPSQDTIPYGVELPQVVTPTENPTNYTIQSGDTLGAIAKRFGVSVNDLAAWNNIQDPNRIYTGQRLVISGKPIVQQEIPTSVRPVAKSMIIEQKPVSAQPSMVWGDTIEAIPSINAGPDYGNGNNLVYNDLSEAEKTQIFNYINEEVRNLQRQLVNGQISKDEANHKIAYLNSVHRLTGIRPIGVEPWIKQIQ